MVVPLSASKQFVRKIAHHGRARQGCAAARLHNRLAKTRVPDAVQRETKWSGAPLIRDRHRPKRSRVSSASLRAALRPGHTVRENRSRSARMRTSGRTAGPTRGWMGAHAPITSRRSGGECSGGVYGFFLCFRLRLLRPLVRLVAAGDERVQRPRATESARIRAPIDGYPTKAGSPVRAHGEAGILSRP
jgi:hypothetical protein